ncbi:hypothetical protein AMATHDRAFT_2129 [Amanita thiersii Skay4041]|uniref:RlpA-like protein double-psi beta-barrel domain-containing protein n=1 Tax=Amanita thiersii Skay4041 TaxID=703135 RepID=A0A2A9NSS8_9AGAR|nr:hypothetical protein AMATHDRAFT_2129 [Amanita thiersii Skay4041]
MLSTILTLALLPLSLILAASANSHGAGHPRRHHDIAKRASGDVQLSKRFEGARWTFYDVGLGACGQFSSRNDFIVALNTPQYGGGYPGPNCFKKIVMTFNGKTTEAVILDQCPGCPFGGLDLSRGLFEFFAPESAGVIHGSWWFKDDGPPPAPPPPPSPTHTTSHWTPPTWSPDPIPWTPSSTHTSTTHSTSSTWSSSSSSTTSQSTSSTSSTSSSASSSATPLLSINYSSGVASGLAVPTGVITTTPDQPENINAMNNLFINIGGLVIAAAL